MKDLAHAKGFRDLLVYQRSKKVADMIFEVSKIFPKEEMYSGHWLLVTDHYCPNVN